MTDVFEFSGFNREGLIYEFTDMIPEQTVEKRKKAEEYAAEQAKKKEEAAPAAPAEPSKEQLLLTEIRDLLKK